MLKPLRIQTLDFTYSISSNFIKKIKHMKTRLLTSLIFSTALLSVHAQTYTDDFESYAPGDYIGSSSSTWSTWSNTPGSSEDTKIDTVKANSGTNSLYFKSTAANGGPQDGLLSFGGEYDLGNFVFETAMYVESGKGAYFNIQSTQTAGQTWQMSANFLHTGTVNFTGSGIDLSATYPMDVWFTIKLEGNLNTSNWEVSINNSSVGTYTAGEIQIASMNIYPVNSTNVGGNGQSSFWMDDISYTHTASTLSQLNGGLVGFDIPTLISGQTKTPKIKLRNLGTDDLTSAEIKFEYNGTSNTETFNFSALASKDIITLEPTNTITLVNGANELKATILKVNGVADTETVDNIATKMIDPIVPATGKIVIAEEGTGTWCGWCPRGAVAMETAAKEYKGFFQGIAVHNGDPMVVPIYDSGMGNLVSGYPSALVDRMSVIDPGNIPASFFQQLTVAPKAILSNGATYDASTNELKVSITVNVNEDISNDWKIACSIVENHVTGTGSGYNQRNYYAGGGNGVMGGYENLPSSVPAADMVYDDVARAISPNFTGYVGFADANQAGDTKTFNFTFQLDATWKKDDIHIVGLLMNSAGQIDNGSTSTIDEAVANGYQTGTNVIGTNEFTFNPKQIEVFPNPAVTDINIKLAEDLQGLVNYSMVDVLGKTVLTGSLENNKEINIDVTTYKEGVYFINFYNDQAQFTQKIVIE